MQAMTSKVVEAKPAKRSALADGRNPVHKRLDRWIRLQQFVFGLPEDYSYAVRIGNFAEGRAESRVVVSVGWMTWFGQGRGSDRQHAIAVALLHTMEALSANGTAVFFHRLSKFFGFWRGKAARLPESSPSAGAGMEERLMAG